MKLTRLILKSWRVNHLQMKKELPPEGITHPVNPEAFPTMDMGVQTSHIHSLIQELTPEAVVTNTNTSIAQESL
ncbi:unnamed protein product [Camellia sinensis]